MPILHIDDDFSVMDVLRDKRLTLADRGLIYTMTLGGLPWREDGTAEVSIDAIAHLSKSGQGGVEGAVKRIEGHGYLTRESVRGGAGRFTSGTWNMHNPA